MNLPSYVPVYDRVPLIDMDAYDLMIVKRPLQPRLRFTWSKLEETERRLVLVDWAIHVVRQVGRNRVLIGDLVSAYLQTFESTLQVLAVEHLSLNGLKLKEWLASQKSYDLLCKGVRTMRHLEAHIRGGRVGISGKQSSSIFGSGPALAWHFPAISVEEYRALLTPALNPAENCEWGEVVQRQPVNELLRLASQRISSIVEAAEAEHVQHAFTTGNADL